MNTHPAVAACHHQRGAVVIVLGVTLAMLIGFIGLALDLGRFFVIKSELQNAMDACALSAASQLRPGLNTAADLTRAVAYGRVFTTGGKGGNDAIRNKANFQSTTVNLADSDITFADSINGSYTTSATVNVNARYAKCEFPLSNLSIYFMQVLNLIGANFTTATVSAMAVAMGGPQICNIIPVGICPYSGIHIGDWLELGDGTGDPAKGWFRWVRFDNEPGADAVKEHLLNAGACNIPTSLVPTQPGNVDSAKRAWNTRFGIYQASFDIDTAPPDKTGYSFFNHSVLPAAKRNWDVADNNPGTGTPPVYSPRALPTFNAGETSPNFWNYDDSFTAISAHTATDPKIFNGSLGMATDGPAGTHNSLGLLQRRLVIIPMMTNCTSTAAIGTSFACGLMLNPFGKVGSDDINGKLEYLGELGPGSPCGSGAVVTPKSVLVQ